MKILDNIYNDIYDYENLYIAYLNARKGKRYRKEVLEFTNNLEENLITLQNELIWKSYTVGKYREFYIFEPKKRLIMALPFRDRVIQWAIYQKINPFFEKQYISHSYACIKGRGTHQAVEKLQYWLKKVHRQGKEYYCLKMDVAKYFYRIDHFSLMRILKSKIKDTDLLWLLETMVIQNETAFGLELDYSKEVRTNKKGMPIGNLTSQMFANVYLNELDQFMKREMKVKYYVRYMDDFFILHEDKAYLHYIKKVIEYFIDVELKLQLNNKTAIIPVKQGIDYLGYKVWATHVKLRKSTSLRMKRRVKQLEKGYNKGKYTFEKVNSSIQSYSGLLRYCNSYNLRKKMLEGITLSKGEI